MSKYIVTLAAALAVVSLGTAAQAGNGSQAAASKYNANVGKTTVHSSITEFSSSSAKTSVPKR